MRRRPYIKRIVSRIRSREEKKRVSPQKGGKTCSVIDEGRLIEQRVIATKGQRGGKIFPSLPGKGEVGVGRIYEYFEHFRDLKGGGGGSLTRSVSYEKRQALSEGMAIKRIDQRAVEGGGGGEETLLSFRSIGRWRTEGGVLAALQRANDCNLTLPGEEGRKRSNQFFQTCREVRL